MHLVDWLAESTGALVEEAANSGDLLTIAPSHEKWTVSLHREGQPLLTESGPDLHDTLAMLNNRLVVEG